MNTERNFDGGPEETPTVAEQEDPRKDDGSTPENPRPDGTYGYPKDESETLSTVATMATETLTVAEPSLGEVENPEVALAELKTLKEDVKRVVGKTATRPVFTRSGGKQHVAAAKLSGAYVNRHGKVVK